MTEYVECQDWLSMQVVAFWAVVKFCSRSLLSSAPASWNRSSLVWRGYCCPLRLQSYPHPRIGQTLTSERRVDFVRRTLIDSELTMTHWSTTIHFDSPNLLEGWLIWSRRRYSQVRVSLGRVEKKRVKGLAFTMDEWFPSSLCWRLAMLSFYNFPISSFHIQRTLLNRHCFAYPRFLCSFLFPSSVPVRINLVVLLINGICNLTGGRWNRWLILTG